MGCSLRLALRKGPRNPYGPGARPRASRPREGRNGRSGAPISFSTVVAKSFKICL